jgi:hypothetical protein
MKLTEYIQGCYSESWQTMATPRIIQWLAGFTVGKNMAITKFVECPVVEITPRLSDVLYTGHVYVGCVAISDCFIGFSHI